MNPNQAISILVIDDADSDRIIMNHHLQKTGSIVKLANCLAAGRAALQDEAFDLVFCDINLPDGTGWELVDELARYPQNSATRIVLMSSATSKEQADAAKSQNLRLIEKSPNAAAAVKIVTELS